MRGYTTISVLKVVTLYPKEPCDFLKPQLVMRLTHQAFSLLAQDSLYDRSYLTDQNILK